MLLRSDTGKMSLITLTTDFGTGDYGIAQMRGVIWGIAPEANIIDLSHEIPPQDIYQAADLLQNTVFLFPAGTVHVVVVDPGVGTYRHAMAARFGEQYYVGPDNGVITPLLKHAEKSSQTVELVALENPDYWLPNITNIFHGRDIFSPVGAHLANGVPLAELGTPLTRPVLLP